MADIPPRLWTRVLRWNQIPGVFRWSAAISILSVGGLFAGSQLARDRGQSVDWYTGFGQWLGALASFVAAGTALWIATRDRKERVQERAADQRAQAKLVVISISPDYNDWPTYTPSVSNHGAQPILDIRLASAEISQHPKAVPNLERTVHPILTPGKSKGFAAIGFKENDSPVPAPPEPNAGDNRAAAWNARRVGFTCWVDFTDAHGNRWAKSNNHELKPLGRSFD